MKSRVIRPLLIVVAVASLGLLTQGAVPDVPTGQWLAGPTLAQPRTGAVPVALDDGGVLLLGGRTAAGPVATTELYDASGTLTVAAPMSMARSGHVAVRLPDGRVLVIGGTTVVATDTGTAEVPVAASEIYDVASNVWYPAGPMGVARSGHSATALADGRVVVAGGAGDAGPLDSIEMFDPQAGVFQTLGVLSSPRTEHGSAVAGATKVIVAGGRSADAVLNTADIVDVDTGTVASIVLGAARAKASVTTLLDGSVLVAGGNDGTNDLATAEVIDPVAGTSTSVGSLSAARSGHLALRLPHNNTVLIVGGTSAGAEQYVPWMGQFLQTGSPSVARIDAAAAGLGAEGVAILAAGQAADATPVAPTELFGFATVKTDKGDYAPGEFVTITGKGWQPGETVNLVIHEVGTGAADTLLNAVAQADGTFLNDFWAPNESHLGVKFFLTATGAGDTAQTTFEDSRTINFVTLNGGVSVTVLPGASISALVDVTTDNGGGNPNWRSTSWRVASTPPGTTTCVDHGNHDAIGHYTETFNITAPTTAGTYNAYFIAHRDDVCVTAQQSNLLTLGSSVIVTAPSVTSIERANSSPTNAASLSWTVTFDRSVTGVTTADFAVVTGLGGAPAITGVTGTGAVYTVTASTGNGTGNLGLNLVDDDSIADSFTNKLGGTGAGNGNFTGQVYSLDRTLTPQVTASNKPFDGGTAATILTRTFTSNLVVTEDVFITGGTATFDNRNAGTGKTVTATGLTLGGTALAKYVLSTTTATTTANITPLAASWTTNASGKTYGDADPAPLTTGSGTGFLGADAVTATYSRAPGETVTGGPYHITATLSSSGLLSNYTITNAGADFTIAPKLATWTTDANSKVYGDADPSPLTTGNGTGFLSADGVTAAYARAAGESVAGGPYHISATLSATVTGALANYTITNAGANFTITARPATWTTNPNTKVYGDADPNPITTGSAVAPTTGTGFLAADGVSATYARDAGESVLGGPYHITATLSAAPGVLANYVVTNAGANFTINARPATWTTDPNTKVYGEADPNPITTGSAVALAPGTGFLPADSVAATYSRDAGESVLGSPYHITATLSAAAGVLANYVVTNNGANFAITARPATWTTDPNSKVYGEADPNPITTGAAAPLATGSGFLAADSVTATYARDPGESVVGGPYQVTATLNAAAGVLANYVVTNAGATFTITARPATWTTDPNSKVYGEADPSPITTGSAAAPGPGSGFLVADSVAATYARDPGENVAGSPYHITATLSAGPGVLANYVVTNTGATFTITARPATWTTNANTKVYGEADPNPITTGSAVALGPGTGFLVADAVSASYTRDAGEGVVGSPYHITATLNAAPGVLANYVVTNAGADFTITARPATWTTDPNSKVYGEADPNPITTGGAVAVGPGTGFLAADSVTASYAREAGESVVGGPYHITATLSAAPGVLANYVVANAGAAFTITSRPATWTTNANTKVYGEADTNPITTGTAVAQASGTGFLVADNVTASYVRDTGESVLGSPYHITATLSAAPGVLANYVVTNAGATFTITARPAAWTTNPASKTYGDVDPDPLTTGSAVALGTGTGFLAADGVSAAYSRAAGETVAGSPYHISAALTASVAGALANYAITNAGADFTINARPATWTTNPASKTYGDLEPSPLTTGSGTGFIAADGVSATYSRVAGETAAGSPYHISATLTATVANALDNYIVTNAGADFTINQRTASVTPDAAGKTYGDGDPALTGTLAGFLAADGVVATYERTAGETVGPYTISATLDPAGVLGNYAITYNTATFAISQRTASVTPNAAGKTYGDADTALTGALVGFLAGDNVTATYSRTAGEAVGPYTISATLDPAGVLGNYAITYNTAAFAISQRTASVTPNAAGKTYGDVDPALTGALVGFLTADGVTASYSRTAGETVGPYTISATLAPGALGNYAITYNTAAFAITQRAASMTPNAAGKVFGVLDPLLSGNLAGFLPADGVTATYARAIGENVGSYAISATLDPAGVLGNYNIAYNTAQFSITPGATTTGIAAPAITVGANGLVTVTVSGVCAPSGNVSLVVDGSSPLTQALSGGSTTFTVPTPGVGGHSLSATFGAQGNCAASGTTATLTVSNVVTTGQAPVALNKIVAVTVRPFHDFDGDDEHSCRYDHDRYDRRRNDGHHYDRRWDNDDDDDDWDREWDRDADEGRGVRVTLTATDADSNRLTFRIITPPAHGMLGRLRKVSCTPNGTGGTTCTARVVYIPEPHFTGADSFTYKANDGALDSNLATVTVNLVPPFATFTQGAWGASPHGQNAADLLDDNFSARYGAAGGVIIGSTKTLKFTSSTKVRDFLPAGGKAGVLQSSAINATTSKAGVFAGQVLALQFNVDFSNAGITRSGLAAMKLSKGALKTWTVGDVLLRANQVLGGSASPPAGLSIADLSDIVAKINETFDTGREDKGYVQP